ncbi:NACHT, LRR and PYD domains-containing protein 3-like isoform X3 [Varanus komodoensis]|nr:NACHT, LRR and PYD domains-containing protein 3-like isoform X3 [Varanus komodoensis]XP_044307274.1 NACHT, LRR and PYD domains-containing protein 3-like isoform X3 [Varanus komodoensis]XP_044307275.1 NACHT, LRR and PYD domains-containing protein 3-like isoform X3 [Varanus komodoensis]
MASREAVMQELLLTALEELSEKELTNFKFKLRYADTPTGEKIPKGRLQDANREQLAEFLVDYYEDKAAALTAAILEEMGLKFIASDLNKAMGMQVQDYKKKYAQNVIDEYWEIEDSNCLLGESTPLSERYVELLIVRKHRPQMQREHELTATGRLHMSILEASAADHTSTDIKDLFDPDESGRTPRTVVMQGSAGIGKTMTVQKIMLDWASGDLYSDLFDYVFCIRCRELDLAGEASSLADHIAKWYQDTPAPVKEILAHPEKLLFIIDGFDELHCFLEPARDHLCDDPYSKVSMEALLSSLLRKELLPKSSLLITTRPGAAERLQGYLKFPRFTEILGFSEKGRRKYFFKFFDNKQALIALSFIENNSVVSTICFIPMVCWIICSVIKVELESKDEITDTMDTTTKVFVQFLHNLLKHESKKWKTFPLNEFRKLCFLARAGVLGQKILFEEKDLKEHNLETSVLKDPFLDRRAFRKVIGRHSLYSFLHLCFQEFFAAVSYILQQEPTEEQANNMEDLKTLLAEYGKPGNEHLTLTVRFIFGLSNEDVCTFLEQTLQCKTSNLVKPLLFQKVEEVASENPPRKGYHLLEFLHCLFENQEAEFAKCVMHRFQEINFSFKTLSMLDCRALAFCLQHSTIKDHSLDLTYCRLKSHHLEALRPGIQNSTTLELGSNKLGNSGVLVLCTIFKELGCNVTTLSLAENYLTDACAQELCTTLSTSQTLKSLHLQDNSFTEASLPFIRHLTETCTSLSFIQLGENSFGKRGRLFLQKQEKKLTNSGRRVLFWL